MSKIKSAIKLLRKERGKFLALIVMNFLKWLPDKIYLKLLYRFIMGHYLNLKNPKTFTEQIQWLKLYNRKSEYTTMVDKYAVKKYVEEKIGKKYIIPTLGLWDSLNDIDFNSLPNKFVLKTTHGGGCGGVVVCRDKNSFDISEAKKKLKESLKSDIYRNYREWPYKNVPRRIIAEKLLEIPNKGNCIIESQIKDYKFFCFNGDPKFLKVDFDRFTNHHANYYDMRWNLLQFGEADFPPEMNHLEICPINFEEMVRIAKKLSINHPFLRVDLYNVNGRIYFGELTFYPASGLGKWTNDEVDLSLGDLIQMEGLST